MNRDNIPCDSFTCLKQAEYKVRTFFTQDFLEQPTFYYYCYNHMMDAVRDATRTTDVSFL